MGSLAVALGVAGCFSDHGVAIEIDVGETGATSVELFLGMEPCKDENSSRIACAGIAPPPSGTPLLTGDVWFRDKGLAPYTADVKGGKATFQLRADTPSNVPIVIAVGLKADGLTGVGTATMTELDVTDRGARIITTTLAPASPLEPGRGPATAEDRVKIWRNAASSCLVIEHGAAGKPDHTFVVPAEDPDCDDAAAPECAPNAWKGALPAGSSAPDCFVRGSSGPPACVLGSRGCRDDDTTAQMACTPQHDRLCVPDLFCDISSCGQFDEGCLRTLLATDSLPHIACEVPTLGQSPLGLCPGNTGIINLATVYQGPCEQQPKISSLSLNGFDTSANFGGAVMELQGPRPACQFNIQWKKGTRLTAGTDYGLIQLPARQNTLLIPISFKFNPDVCATKPFQCEVKGSTTDSLWKCAL